VVATAFVSSFVTLGVAYSFGAFFRSMAEEFDSTRGATAVIFGVTTFSFFTLSVITGRAADVWGPRRVLVIGAIAYVVGLWATSAVNSLVMGYVTYGAGVGIAAACGYIPMVAMVGGWFERWRATAVGLAVAGIGAGTLLVSPLSASLIESVGWRQTFRILAVGGGVLLLISAIGAERPPSGAGPGGLRFGERIGSPVLRRLYVSALCSGIALFIPFIFIGQYANDQGVGAVAAAVLVGILGGSSVVARIGFGALVRRYGSMPLYRASFALLAAGYAVWFAARGSFAVLLAAVVVFGVGYGGFVALSTIVLAERFSVVGLGALMGLFYTSQGLGGLIGPPLAGWMIDTTGSYAPVMLGGVGLELAALALVIRLPQ